jgi:hypothetical protein
MDSSVIVRRSGNCNKESGPTVAGHYFGSESVTFTVVF